MTTIKLRSHVGSVPVQVTIAGCLVVGDAAREALEYDIAYAAMGGGDSELFLICSQLGDQQASLPLNLMSNLLKLLRVLSFEDIKPTIGFYADCVDHVIPRLDTIHKVCVDYRDTESARTIKEILQFVRLVSGGKQVTAEEVEVHSNGLARFFAETATENSLAVNSTLNSLTMAMDGVRFYFKQGWGVRGIAEAFSMFALATDYMMSVAGYARLGGVGWDDARSNELRWQIHHIAEVIERLQVGIED
jgi:hypothetical protein